MTLPSQVLDLSTWKITLPTGDKNKPKELSGKDLAAYSNTSTFWVGADGAVHFRAAVNGVTTSGSANPRSELRELNAGGSLASWSSTDGETHTLVVSEAFVHMPNARTSGTAGVVGAQIHDADDDISVFRCEGSKLYVTNGDDTHYALADGAYVAGTRFEAKFVVADGKVQAFYNGALVATIAVKFSGGYFKAGCYTQANSTNSKPANSTNFGEVAVFSVAVSHGVTQPPTEPLPPVVVPPVEVPPVVTPPVSKNITVRIIRHGEKPGVAPDTKAKGYTAPTGGKVDSHSLTLQGWARAQRLVGLFSAAGTKPDVVYCADGPDAGERMKQTGSLLCTALGVTPVLKFDKGDEKNLAKALKTLVGKSALVIWEHGEILDIVKNLGTVTPKPPKSWPDGCFDVVLELVSADAGKTWTLRQWFEGFGLPGDKATVLK